MQNVGFLITRLICSLIEFTGKQVLNELGLDVEVYYASEINEDAKLVATCHHSVTHVGDAAMLTRDRVSYTITITCLWNIL